MDRNVVIGVMLPFLGTSLGAAVIFFLRRSFHPAWSQAMNGSAAGIMAAASFFSLLQPAAAQGGVLPTVAGFLPGALFLRCVDDCLLHIRSARSAPLRRTEKLLLAVTLHNLPEGMAVGAVCAGYLYGAESAAAALALALGIALQNIPEGALVSLPLESDGVGMGRAFLAGVLSGAVEPLGAMLILLAAGLFLPVMPWLLSFAAGAMFSVIIEELIPASDGAGSACTLYFSLGFSVMMLLDLWLG